MDETLKATQKALANLTKLNPTWKGDISDEQLQVIKKGIYNLLKLFVSRINYHASKDVLRIYTNLEKGSHYNFNLIKGHTWVGHTLIHFSFNPFRAVYPITANNIVISCRYKVTDITPSEENKMLLEDLKNEVKTEIEQAIVDWLLEAVNKQQSQLERERMTKRGVKEISPDVLGVIWQEPKSTEEYHYVGATKPIKTKTLIKDTNKKYKVKLRG